MRPRQRVMLQNHQIIQKTSKFRAICSCAQCQGQFACGIYDARKSRIGHLCEACKSRIVNLTAPDQSALLEVFAYDEATGQVRHKLDSRSGLKGELATYAHHQGYLQISIGGREYLAHRVIWMMKTGSWPYQVDHQDHDRTNNIWSNLREVSPRENQMNMSRKRSNSSGVTGVRILPSGKFCAYIMIHRKQIALGTYDTIDEAVQARKLAEQRHGFHANHGS